MGGDWGIDVVELGESVPAASQVSFDIPLTAPASEGNYVFEVGMFHEGLGWIGPRTSVPVKVVVPNTSGAPELVYRYCPITDTDGDGESNLAEYALGGDLRDSSVKAQMPFIVLSEGQMSFDFTRRNDPRLIYVLEEAGEDFDFQVCPIQPDALDPEASETFLEQVMLGESNYEKRFYRMRVIVREP